jgi:hypothetical protein
MADCPELRKEVQEAREKWDILVDQEARLASTLAEIHNFQQIEREILNRTFNEAWVKASQLQKTLDTLKYHRTQLENDESKAKEDLKQIENVASRVCKCQQHIHKTLELQQTARVEQTKLSSQVWEIMNNRLTLQIQEQEELNEKASIVSKMICDQVDEADLAWRDADCHVAQLSNQIKQQDLEHLSQVADISKTLDETRKNAEKAHEMLIFLETLLDDLTQPSIGDRSFQLLMKNMKDFLNRS